MIYVWSMFCVCLRQNILFCFVYLITIYVFCYVIQRESVWVSNFEISFLIFANRRFFIRSRTSSIMGTLPPPHSTCSSMRIIRCGFNIFGAFCVPLNSIFKLERRNLVWLKQLFYHKFQVFANFITVKLCAPERWWSNLKILFSSWFYQVISWALHDKLQGSTLIFPQLRSRTTMKQYGLVRNRNLLGHDDNILFVLQSRMTNRRELKFDFV